MDEELMVPRVRPRGSGRAAGAHVLPRGVARKRGLEVAFDDRQRVEYVTGFGKRKAARRKQAESEQRERDRRAKIQERRERRKEMYGDAVVDGPQGEGEGAEAAAPEARAYADDGGVTVIVEDIRDEDEGPPGTRGSPAAAETGAEAEKEAGPGKKRRGAGGPAQKKKRAKARTGGRKDGAKGGGAGKRKRQGKKKHRAK